MARTSVTMKWYGERCRRDLRAELLDRLEAAAEHVVEQTKQNIAAPGPPASRPGEYPHRVSGELQGSISSVVNARDLSVRVVATAPHARFVEARRSFLRRTFRESRSTIRQIVLGGTGQRSGRFKFK